MTCSVSSICPLPTADSGVKFDNLCIKRQTLSLLNKEDQLLITDHREGNGHCRVAAAEDTVYSPEYVCAS